MAVSVSSLLLVSLRVALSLLPLSLLARMRLSPPLLPIGRV